MRQFNIRVPEELTDDIRDLCFEREWKIDLTCIEFMKLGYLVAKNPELHEEMNKIIEKAKIVNVSKPDYVQLVTQQFEEIQKLSKIKGYKIMTVNPSHFTVPIPKQWNSFVELSRKVKIEN